MSPGPSTTMKECTLCHGSKPLDQFWRSTQSVDGYHWRCKTCMNHRARSRWAGRDHRYKLRRNARAMGLTDERWSGLLARSGGCCEACGAAFVDGKYHTDHDHSCCPTMKTCGHCIRGLLCPRCNIALGYIEDESVRDALLAYLDRFSYCPHGSALE